jgi:hypothetical protein
MGGVVSEIGDIGQGIISGVDEALTDLDDSLPEEAKIAAAIYLASQGLPVGAEGSALANLGATDASLGAAGAANASAGGFTGAIATPVAEPMAMFLLMVPLLILYFLAAGVAFLHDKRVARKIAALELVDPQDAN